MECAEVERYKQTGKHKHEGQSTTQHVAGSGDKRHKMHAEEDKNADVVTRKSLFNSMWSLIVTILETSSRHKNTK